MKRRALVAADGSAESMGALRAATRLAATGRFEVIGLAVLEPVGAEGGTYAGAGPLHRMDLLDQEAGALRDAVVRQARESGAAPVAETLRIEVGPVARTIVRVAHEVGAELIVLGTAPDAPLERWFGDHTTFHVVQFAHIPVFAVPAQVDRLPSRILVGVDFSVFSLDALRTVLAVLGEDAEIHLVHVVSGLAPLAAEHVGQLPAEAYAVADPAEAVRARLGELAETLRDPGIRRVETHVLQGNPATELLGLADRLKVDAIAVGSHGHGFWGRLVLGSVSAGLLRRHRALFVAPPRSLPAELSLPRLDEPDSTRSPG